MAKGINKVILIGALGNDPEVRTTQAGAGFYNNHAPQGAKLKRKVR